MTEEKESNTNTFVEEFYQFSEKIRDKLNIGEEQFWPLDRLYIVLEQEEGGFLLDTGNHACLGLSVKASKKEEGWYKVKYRDPFHTEPKELQLNTKTMQSKEGNKIKIQWYGTFDFLKEYHLNPGFSKLELFKYKLELPKEHETLAQSDTFRCGDISAYLATKSTVKFKVPKEYKKK